MKFSQMVFESISFDDQSKQFQRKVLTALAIVLVGVLLSGCTTTAESQLKESPCLECAKKTPFYRNGEWLHG